MLNSHMKSHVTTYMYRCADCNYATKYCHRYGHEHCQGGRKQNNTAFKGTLEGLFKLTPHISRALMGVVVVGGVSKQIVLERPEW